MAVFSEFSIDGETRDLYDKAAVHDDEFDDTLDDSIDDSVVTLYTTLGVTFS